MLGFRVREEIFKEDLKGQVFHTEVEGLWNYVQADMVESG